MVQYVSQIVHIALERFADVIFGLVSLSGQEERVPSLLRPEELCLACYLRRKRSRLLIPVKPLADSQLVQRFSYQREFFLQRNVRRVSLNSSNRLHSVGYQEIVDRLEIFVKELPVYLRGIFRLDLVNPLGVFHPIEPQRIFLHQVSLFLRKAVVLRRLLCVFSLRNLLGGFQNVVLSCVALRLFHISFQIQKHMHIAALRFRQL